MKTMTKRILVSAACLGMASLLLVYASWAWFSSSRAVRATGITLHVQTPNNVQISLTGGDSDTEWTEALEVDTKTLLASQIADFDPARPVFILPASTYAGMEDTVYATSRAKSDGQAYEDTIFYAGKPIVFSSQSGSYEGHFLDVPLYFRTRDESGVSLHLSKTEPGHTTGLASSDGSEIHKIARVAFLSGDKTANALGGTAPLVYAEEDRQTASVVTGESHSFALPQYLAFSGGVSEQSVVEIGGPVTENGVTKPAVQKAVLRIWIEGQDSRCTMNMGKKTFSVDLAFTAI